MTTSNIVPVNLKERLKDSYDAIAENYTAWAAKTADIRLGYLDRLLSLLSPEHSDVLEIGCGAGIPTTETMLARNPNFRITANDLSSNQITLGKARLDHVGGGHRVTWVEGDMMTLNFPPASFDVVVGFYSVFHLPRDEQAVMLGRIAQWLRPGGFLLVNFPAEDENGEMEMSGWMGEKGWMWSSRWSTPKYRELVKDVGLDMVVDEVHQDNVRARFLWIIGNKP